MADSGAAPSVPTLAPLQHALGNSNDEDVGLAVILGKLHAARPLWQPGTLWLNVGSDALIAVSYFLIPVALYYFVRQRRKEIPYAWLPLMFGAFIQLCGATHVMEIWTVWHPIYRSTRCG